QHPTKGPRPPSQRKPNSRFHNSRVHSSRVHSSLIPATGSDRALGSDGMSHDVVTVVLPCLNEAEALPAVLSAIPVGYRALVVDNNSTDDTAGVAGRHGAQVVAEP